MFCEIDGWAKGLGCWCRCCLWWCSSGVLFVVLVTVRVHFCKIDGSARGHAVWGAGLGAVLGMLVAGGACLAS